MLLMLLLLLMLLGLATWSFEFPTPIKGTKPKVANFQTCVARVHSAQWKDAHNTTERRGVRDEYLADFAT